MNISLSGTLESNIGSMTQWFSSVIGLPRILNSIGRSGVRVVITPAEYSLATRSKISGTELSVSEDSKNCSLEQTSSIDDMDELMTKDSVLASCDKTTNIIAQFVVKPTIRLIGLLIVWLNDLVETLQKPKVKDTIQGKG